MEIQDFASEYTTKSNEELLRLALDPTQLTVEANFALSAERATVASTPKIKYTSSSS